MKAQPGQRYVIAGMTLEILADNGDQWEVLNLTTRETRQMDKKTLDEAIRFGRAEEVQK